MRRFLALAALAAPAAFAFNSEEHKLLGDQGSAAVAVCQGGARGRCRPERVMKGNVPLLRTYDVARPGNVALVVHAQQAKFKKEALSRQPAYRKANQKGQEHYVKEIYVPPQDGKMHKPLLVWVGNAASSAGGDWFSFGDLVAIYGDYRRAVTCDANRMSCLLSDSINARTPAAHRHLRNYARGEVAPFGSASNVTADSAPHGNDSMAGWWGDEMLRIANTNDWHFAGSAIRWYVGSHRQALWFARLAAEKNDPAFLWHAVHYDANGLHSLTDLFAPGHVITDRERSVAGMHKNNGSSSHPISVWNQGVDRLGKAGAIPAPLAAPSRSDIKGTRGTWALWARWEESAHTQFNQNGAIVKNERGEEFIAFGDGRLYARKDPTSADQTAMNPPKLAEVAGRSVKSSLECVFSAYWRMLAAAGKLSGPARTAKVDAEMRKIAAEPSYYEALRDVPVEVKEACYRPAGDQCFGVGRWMSARYRNALRAILGQPAAAGPVLPLIDGKKYVRDYGFDKGKGQAQATAVGVPAREPDKI